MYETTISDVQGRDEVAKKSFIEVFARDEILKSKNYPASFVMNTQNGNQPGERWLAVYYKKIGHCYFCDSNAHPTKYYNMQNYIKKNINQMDLYQEKNLRKFTIFWILLYFVFIM